MTGNTIWPALCNSTTSRAPLSTDILSMNVNCQNPAKDKPLKISKGSYGCIWHRIVQPRHQSAGEVVSVAFEGDFNTVQYTHHQTNFIFFGIFMFSGGGVYGKSPSDGQAPSRISRSRSVAMLDDAAICPCTILKQFGSEAFMDESSKKCKSRCPHVRLFFVRHTFHFT